MKQSGSGSNQQCPTAATSQKKKKNQHLQTMPFVGFFDPMIYFPQILDCPQRAPRKFSNTLLDSQTIRGIKVSPYFVQILLKSRQQRHYQKQLNTVRNWSFQNEEIANFIKNASQCFLTYLTNFILNFFSKNPGQPSFQFSDWLKSMQNKNYIAWHLPLTPTGPKMRSYAISKKTLALLGYGLQESAIDIMKYYKSCFDMVDNNCYKEIFGTYTEGICKYMSSENSGNNYRKINQESTKVMTNVFIAKNERTIRAQVKISMPSPSIMCMEVVKIIKRSNIVEQNLNQQKLMMNQQAQLNAIRSLQYVARIKGIPSETQVHRICSYVAIDNDIQMKDCN